MKCRVCGKEIEEGSEFCRYCGASQKKKRKPTWSERRKEKERETAEILKKSYLTEQDVALAVPTGTQGLVAKEIGETRKEFVRCALLGALYLAVTAALVAALIVMMRFAPQSLSRTLRAVICFAILLALACFGAAAADRIYSARVFSVMSKSERAIKKIVYGKAPYVSYEGKLYQLVCNAKCIACGGSTHIEEFEGKMYEVCDFDRTHIFALQTSEIFSELLGARDAYEEDVTVKEENSDAAERKEGQACGADGEDGSLSGGEKTSDGEPCSRGDENSGEGTSEKGE